MKILNIIRSQEWWAHKIPPLLAIGYATALMSDIPLYEIAFWFIFLLFALIIGAIYVSIINDITDLDEDLASGKANRIQQVNPKWRWLIPTICVLIGVLCGYFIYPDLLSCLLYSLSWIAFSMYSIKPFRLKNRGILGVLADAFGSHLFPSLLMVSSICYFTNQPIKWIWFIAVGIWAFCYGLRGILWHQFQDRDNDIKVNINTYASRIQPNSFKYPARVLFITELAMLILLLHTLALAAPIIAFGLYSVLVCIRYFRYKNQIILVTRKNELPYQILMADYYQLFLPVSILIAASLKDDLSFTVLLIHLLLFPYALWLAIHDYVLFTVYIFRKKILH